MRKYWKIFTLALQTNIQYRVDTLGWILVGIVPNFSFIAVWLLALGNKSDIGGFTKGDFLAYFFFGVISWYLIGGTFSYQMGQRIKDGNINKFLLSPLNFTFSHYLSELAWKITALFFSVPFIILFFILFGDSVHFQWSLFKLVTLVISVIAGSIIFAFMQAIIGLSAFWFTDILSVIEADDIMMGLFGGRVAPIVLMPAFIQTIANFLPYKYVFYVPIIIFLDKAQNPLTDIQFQLFFIVVLFLIYTLLWRMGLKHYEGVGA